jgi:hypothetical protein
MDATLQNTSKRQGVFSMLLQKVAKEHFPRRFKRLIYISSILAIVKEIKEPEQSEVLVNKLNDVFKIAKYPQAMMYSMYIKSMVWRDLSNEDAILLNEQRVLISQLQSKCLNESDCLAVGKYFNDKAPEWLKYGSERLMVNDVVILMQHLKDFNNECSLA